MKQLMSLSIAVMLGVGVFAQDTIPGKPKSPTAPTTVPGNVNPNLNDTSRLGNKWPKDSVNKNGWPSTDSTLRSNPTGTDSMVNGVANQPGRDSMHSMHQNSAATTNSGDSSSSAANAYNKTGKDTSNASSEKLTDRIMMKDDQMYIVKNNESNILDKDYKLESGATVTPDGVVKYAGGKTVKLKNGQFIELTPASDADNTKGRKKTTKSTKKPGSKSTSGQKKKSND